MMHVDGNRQPGLPLMPEFVSSQVYATSYIKDEIADGSIAIARLNQLFVENIAMPSIERWERAMRQSGQQASKCSDFIAHTFIGVRLGYSSSMPPTARAYSYNSPPPMVPPPSPPTSSFHTIVGRPVGALELAIATLHPSSTREGALTVPASDYEALKKRFHQLQDTSNAFEAAVSEAQLRITELEAEIQEQVTMCCTAEEELAECQVEVRNLTAILTVKERVHAADPSRPPPVTVSTLHD